VYVVRGDENREGEWRLQTGIGAVSASRLDLPIDDVPTRLG
jgi:hypothetical protein